jgi:hypothetical protein
MQNNDEIELEPEHQNLSPDVQALLRQGRKAQKDAEALKAQLAQEQLQVAIERAGVPNHPARDLVFKDYSGPTDAEAIMAHAEKFGLTPPSQTSSGPTAEEMNAQRQILNAGGGAPPASGDTDLAVALRNAKSQAEVMAIVRQMSENPGFRSHDGLIGVSPEY